MRHRCLDFWVRSVTLVIFATFVAACEESPPTNTAPKTANPKVANVHSPAVLRWSLRQECEWRIMGDDGNERATISTGDGGLMLHFDNPVFLTWSMEDRPRIELKFDGDRERRVEAEGWSTHGAHGGDITASFGLYMDEKARQLMGGTKRLQLLRDGKTIIDLRVADTPGVAELESCTPPPYEGHSHEEE